MKGVFFSDVFYNKDLIKSKIDKGFSLIGGFFKYFKKGDKVLLKPNLLAQDPPEKATTTHPVFFEAVCQYFLDNGINIIAGDSPAISKSLDAARVSGILDVCNRLNIPFATMEKSYKVVFKNGIAAKSFDLAFELKNIDKVVSLPKLKNHALTIYTGSMKNLFGLIPGRKKAMLHTKYPDIVMFSHMIVDLLEVIKPTISIMDAILAQEGNGPRGGNPVYLNTLIMGEHPFIVDLIASYYIGYNPEKIPIIREFGFRHKLSFDLKDHEIFGDKILVVKNFKKTKSKNNMLSIGFLTPIIEWLFTPKPHVIKDKCMKCGLCYETCPSTPKTISWAKNEIPQFNYNYCIRCFCCQEACPYSAIIKK